MNSNRRIRTCNLRAITIMLAASAFLLFDAGLRAQEKEIDASKPTNLYTQLSNSAEWSRTKDGANLYGYRGSISLASANQRHLLMGELPLLYNDKTSKFGLSDIRLRYFGITHLDYSKKFGGVWAGSVDLIAPTGKFEDGLGTGSWVIAPGIVGGLILSKTFQSFPIVSYQFISKSSSDLIPEAQKKARHGLTFQAITVLNFNSWFLWLTPIYVIPDLGDSSQKNRFIIELNPSLNPVGNVKPSAFYRYDFQNKSHQLRASVIIYI